MHTLERAVGPVVLVVAVRQPVDVVRVVLEALPEHGHELVGAFAVRRVLRADDDVLARTRQLRVRDGDAVAGSPSRSFLPSTSTISDTIGIDEDAMR